MGLKWVQIKTTEGLDVEETYVLYTRKLRETFPLKYES